MTVDLGTDAGRAVTTSVYGPLATILHILSVFHSNFSFALLLSRLHYRPTGFGQRDGQYGRV